MLMPNGPAATVGLELQARAGVHTPVSACASGAEAVALALDILRAGRADVVVCGGTEASVHPLPMAGFAAMRALSTRNDDPEAASRPYDKARDGFLLGEGAGILVLERRAAAEQRGARIYAEVAGAGITVRRLPRRRPRPGRAPARPGRCGRRSRTPGSPPTRSATSTRTPPRPRPGTSRRRWPSGPCSATTPPHVPVSATKSQTGHLLGAAGAVEAILSVLALHHSLAPATRNLDDPDDVVAGEAELDVVRVDHRRLTGPTVALSNSFGFGGHNVALVLRSA